MTKKEANRLAKWLNEAPKTVRVGPADYSIEFIKGWIKQPNDEKNYWGTCENNVARLTIAIPDGAQGVLPVAMTVWHELLHAFWHIANLGLGKVKEEPVVQGLEYVSIAFMRDNPETMKWLLKGLK